MLIPSLSDCLFLAILLWVFAAGSGWSVLLADGDTGWHIRTGEYILDTRAVPVRDLFSFSKAGQPWFAWEWLSDVIFALLHRAWGLKGVVAFTGLVLSFSSALLYRYMIWRGANLLAALGATLLAAGASTVHYLARPHIFTLLGLTAAVWILEQDRRRPGRAVWWLVPMTAVWTNLHGGFLAWIACLGLVAVSSLWQAALDPRGTPRRFYSAGRYAGLAGACTLATFANPYGWRLHQHIVSYLRSDWIRQVVDEFQSPRFRSESMLQFEILLFAGLALITPESIYPLLPTDPKPLPTMLKEFLPSLSPRTSAPGKVPRGEHPEENPAAAIETKPASPAAAVVPILPGGTVPVEEADPAAETPGARQKKAAADGQPGTAAAPDAGSGIDASPSDPATVPDTAEPTPEVNPTAGGALKPQAEAPGH